MKNSFSQPTLQDKFLPVSQEFCGKTFKQFSNIQVCRDENKVEKHWCSPPVCRVNILAVLREICKFFLNLSLLKKVEKHWSRKLI